MSLKEGEKGCNSVRGRGLGRSDMEPYTYAAILARSWYLLLRAVCVGCREHSAGWTGTAVQYV